MARGTTTHFLDIYMNVVPPLVRKAWGITGQIVLTLSVRKYREIIENVETLQMSCDTTGWMRRAQGHNYDIIVGCGINGQLWYYCL